MRLVLLLLAVALRLSSCLLTFATLTLCSFISVANACHTGSSC